MIIEKIKLNNFRSYESLLVYFNGGINCFYGDNGCGKTNLLEAIYYSSLAKSFRTNKEESLININNDFFVINAWYKLNNLPLRVDIQKTSNGKKILLDNTQIKSIGILANKINMIYFIPQDANLMKNSPKARRDYLNINISRLNNNYLINLANYEHILKLRNECLKQDNPDLILIEVYEDQLIDLSKKIYLSRKKFFEDVNSYVNSIYKKITNKNDFLHVNYVPLINDLDNYENNLKKEYRDNIRNDLLKKTTTIGIHLEDFYISLNGKNIALYGSQGENRISILALKLSSYYICKDEEKKPIIILDDVLSEIDDDKKDSFLYLLTHFKQVFITSTNKLIHKNIKIHNYKVSNNKVFVKKED